MSKEKTVEDLLLAAKEELKELKAGIVYGFYEEAWPQYSQGQDNLCELHEQVSADEVNNLVDRLKIATEALRTIKEHYGKVCSNYESCKHKACASSYGAWATADEALRKLGQGCLDEGCPQYGYVHSHGATVKG